jgi:hypothetical protein
MALFAPLAVKINLLTVELEMQSKAKNQQPLVRLKYSTKWYLFLRAVSYFFSPVF